MSQGDLSTITLHHWQVALSTGLAVGLIAFPLSFGKLKNIESSRWGVALVAFVGTVIADWFVHSSNSGSWSEAVITGVGAALLSLLISFTRLSRLIGRLETNG